MCIRDRSEAMPVPVSYTHLDVYKRQVRSDASACLLYTSRCV
ncbi:hypothetical protein [Sphingobium sp. B2]|nr:hypothetical protein [Sphingobium sp. B2]